MNKHSIKDILAGHIAVGSSIEVNGWVRTRRDSKAGISFIMLSDGSCFDSLQLIAPNTLANYESDIQRLTAGCAIRAIGTLVESQGQNQSVEMTVTELNVVGMVEEPETYPMAAKRHTMEHLRDYSHLRPRTNVIGAVTRVRHSIAMAIHRYFDTQGFFWINTPIVTACDAEGAGEMFTVSTLDMMNLPRTANGNIDFNQDFFGQRAYLTVSGQLNVEAYCLAMSKVYTFGPTFRAENSNTTRHLAEFWMVEPEIAFADLHDDIALAQDLIRYVARDVLNRNADDMAFFAKWVDKDCIQRLRAMLNNEFEIIEYTDAVNLLQKADKKFTYPIDWGVDLQTEHERYLTEELIKKPVVVINYPKRIKAFYMRLNDDDKTVAAMDVLLPGVGEIVGGSQREERLDILHRRLIEEAHLDPEEYEWYLDLRRYGTVPHAGFGLGFERLIRYITGVANVRDVIPFARAPQHIPPNKPTLQPAD